MPAQVARARLRWTQQECAARVFMVPLDILWWALRKNKFLFCSKKRVEMRRDNMSKKKFVRFLLIWRSVFTPIHQSTAWKSALTTRKTPNTPRETGHNPPKKPGGVLFPLPPPPQKPPPAGPLFFLEGGRRRRA